MLKCRLKEVTHLLRFCNLNSPCLAISTRMNVYEPSEDDSRLFIANSMICVFASLWSPYLCPSEGMIAPIERECTHSHQFLVVQSHRVLQSLHVHPKQKTFFSSWVNIT